MSESENEREKERAHQPCMRGEVAGNIGHDGQPLLQGTLEDPLSGLKAQVLQLPHLRDIET